LVVLTRAKLAEERETINDRHPQIKEDRVRNTDLCFVQASFPADCGPNGIALKLQHPGERLYDGRIVIDDVRAGRGRSSAGRIRQRRVRLGRNLRNPTETIELMSTS